MLELHALDKITLCYVYQPSILFLDLVTLYGLSFMSNNIPAESDSGSIFTWRSIVFGLVFSMSRIGRLSRSGTGRDDRQSYSGRGIFHIL